MYRPAWRANGRESRRANGISKRASTATCETPQHVPLRAPPTTGPSKNTELQQPHSSDEGLESAFISLAEEHYSLSSGTSGLRSCCCPDFSAAQPPRFQKQRSTGFPPY